MKSHARAAIYVDGVPTKAKDNPMRHDFHDYQRTRRTRRQRISEADAWRALLASYATPATLLLIGMTLTIALLFFFG